MATGNITPAQALEALAKAEGIWPSLVTSAHMAQTAGRRCDDLYDACWSLLYGAGCDLDEGTRWDRLLVKMFPETVAA
jgi:hypothetical protein